ncbi:MAG: CidA/LrgA family protein [Fluviibacter sp.]|jgi:holin-like protein
MIAALTWLLLYQLAGEVLARVLSLPVPGPVIGMALLFCTLVIRGHLGRPIPQTMQHTAHVLLQHLSLLFVPAGTGVMIYLQLIADEWLPITAALIVSTIGGMAVTALLLKALTRRQPTAEARDA